MKWPVPFLLYKGKKYLIKLSAFQAWVVCALGNEIVDPINTCGFAIIRNAPYSAFLHIYWITVSPLQGRHNYSLSSVAAIFARK